jgi:hypothetical protein
MVRPLSESRSSRRRWRLGRWGHPSANDDGSDRLMPFASPGSGQRAPWPWSSIAVDIHVADCWGQREQVGVGREEAEGGGRVEERDT